MSNRAYRYIMRNRQSHINKKHRYDFMFKAADMQYEACDSRVSFDDFPEPNLKKWTFKKYDRIKL